MPRESSSPVDDPSVDDETEPFSALSSSDRGSSQRGSRDEETFVEGRRRSYASAQSEPQEPALPDEDERPSPVGDAQEDDLVGRVLGGSFRIVRVIGEGGTGRVYEAHHTRVGQKRFAVKVLHAEYLRHPEAWIRFQREAEAAASIEHPRVVTVYDVDRTEDGLPYLVYEYLEGVELGDLLKQRGTLSPRAAARVVQELCEGLSAAHDKGVIHRDVKPQNIWLMGSLDQPDVKVLDFGLSRLRDDAAVTVTKTGAVLGTPAYMSPEQARGERVDHRSDVYGAGTVLYSALTGRPPFEEENVQRTLLCVMSKEPERPRSIVPIIPEGLELVVQRAMAKEPDERYATVDELREALEPFAERPRGDNRPAAPSIAPAGASRSSLVLAIATILLLAPALALSVVIGVARAFDKGFSDLELVFLLVAMVGTAITPVVLWLRRVRRNVWNNGVRVQLLTRRLAGVSMGALIGYGGAALSVRLLDELFGLGSGTPGAAWGPLNAVYAVVALLSGAAASVLAEPKTRHWTARAVGPLAALTSVGVVALGLMWRSDEAVRAVAEVGLTEAPGVRPRDTERLAAQAARAPEEELARAVTKGVGALEDLQADYPGDPAVRHALALAHGEAEDYPEAMRQLAALLDETPDFGRDRAVRVLVSKAARHAASEEAALTLAASKMGSDGLDLLWDLMLKDSELKPKIDKLFETADLRARFSPALAVAYDIFHAKDCDTWAKLAEEAGRVGDRRSVVLLAPLVKGSRTGCGYYKNRPCAAACKEQRKTIVEALHKIRTRTEP